MSAVWPTVALGEVIDHRKEFIIIDDVEIYRRPRVQLHAQGIILRDAVPGAEIKTKKQQVAREGELLVAEIDAKVGGFGIVPNELDGSIVSSHYFLYRHRPDRLDNRYLGWFVKTRAFRQQVEAQGSTNYAAIRANDVLGYQIPLPPLPEQRRIVARIEQLAAKVEEARKFRTTATDEVDAHWPATLKLAFDGRLVGAVPFNARQALAPHAQALHSGKFCGSAFGTAKRIARPKRIASCRFRYRKRKLARGRWWPLDPGRMRSTAKPDNGKTTTNRSSRSPDEYQADPAGV